ncbi:MAG: PEP-CTERM sorting domain-containing protein [bacterium]|nr:PEP-CTERM sorting domain-containing protein [bacterium]
MRLFSSILAGLATFAIATTASAGLNIDVQADRDPLGLLPDSGQLTLTITLDVDTLGEAQGLTLRAAGLGNGLTFASATLANQGVFGAAAGGSAFGTLTEIAPGFFAYSGGIDSILAGAVDNGDNVVLFDGVSTGTTTGAGPEVFTLTLDVGTTGSGVLEIGAIESFGDAFVSNVDGTSFPTTTVAYNIVPEPGTALLMGLGLAGLAAAGRRE